jgi:hypothetical protein
MPLSSQNSSSDITGKILFFFRAANVMFQMLFRHGEHSSGHGTYERFVLYKVHTVLPWGRDIIYSQCCKSKGLDVLGFEHQWGKIFSRLLTRPALS